MRSSARSLRSKIFLLFLCVILAAGGVWGFREYQFRTLVKLENPGNEELQTFEIAKGAPLPAIARQLEAEGFISSAWVFERYAKQERIAEQFQAGRFYFAQNLTIADVAAKLLNAKKREEFFTIPEGLTLAEIDERIADKGYAEVGTFLACIESECDFSEFSFLPTDRSKWEGYFFPETYSVVPENFSAQLLAKAMLRQFEKRAGELGILQDPQLENMVIMASMVEKESRKDEERPIVSGILWKRLEENWFLGVDATVRYFTGKKTEPLTVDDLNASNPYNTRNRTGMPPTAICNPGYASLSAAANPEQTPYYYYLHAPNGQIHYAVTNAEHNANKQRYL